MTAPAPKVVSVTGNTGAGTSNTGAPVTGCLLHGFGATSGDLLPLADLIDPARRWYAPDAPIPISIGGIEYGRAWFPRDPALLQQALTGGYFSDLRRMEPPDLQESAREVRRRLDHRGADWSRLVVVGFSQGAMVAAELLRQGLVENLPMPDAVLILSGALIAERWWRESTPPRVSNDPRPRVFMTHGLQDLILPCAEGRALRDTLRNAGFLVIWHEFDGEHQISEKIIPEIQAFLH